MRCQNDITFTLLAHYNNCGAFVQILKSRRGNLLTRISKDARMIDHIMVAVKSYARSKEFYTKALAPLGYTLVMEPMPNMGGFGKHGKPCRLSVVATFLGGFAA